MVIKLTSASNECTIAVNHKCEKKKCEHLHCKRCHRKLCPVCKGHYAMMIWADDDEGCCVGCVKITRGDTQPFYPGENKNASA